MRRPINLFLIGPMGAGKSTIGRHLARELKLDFYDTDQEIEARTGADIAWIYDVEGEEGFRRREANVIDELTQKNHIVLATGGGAILTPDNRNRLAARGAVVYLKTSVEQQVARTARDKRRPSLQDNDIPEETLQQMFEEREPLYQEIADIIVETDGRTVRSVANDVVQMLESEEF